MKNIGIKFFFFRMFINNFNIQEENKTKIIAEEISKICKKGDV